MAEQTSPATSTPSLLFAEPQLYVTNIAASLEYYTNKLGFEVRLQYGKPPFWAQVVRDGVRLNLRHVDGPAFEAALRVKEADAISATIVVANVSALFQEYDARGVEFHQALKTEAWGTVTFIVADLDGNLLLFADAGMDS